MTNRERIVLPVVVSCCIFLLALVLFYHNRYSETRTQLNRVAEREFRHRCPQQQELQQCPESQQCPDCLPCTDPEPCSTENEAPNAICIDANTNDRFQLDVAFHYQDGWRSMGTLSNSGVGVPELGLRLEQEDWRYLWRGNDNPYQRWPDMKRIENERGKLSYTRTQGGLVVCAAPLVVKGQ